MQEILDLLLPCPKSVKKQGNSRLYINHNFILNSVSLKIANIFNEKLKEILGFELKTLPNYPKANLFMTYSKDLEEEEYELDIMQDIKLQAGGYRGLLYGAYTILQLLTSSNNMLPQIILRDKPTIKQRGFYQDITRGKVPSLNTLKKLVDELSYYKYNELQFYIEHSFAFEGMEQVWFDKTPLTAKDILELDEYAFDRGIELIPSLTTFGHMYEILRTSKFKNLCERENPDTMDYSFIERQLMHTLNIFDENSFKLVCNMIDQYTPLFRSNKFNICADETFDLCKFKNANKLNEKNSFEIYTEFVLKIADYVKAKGKSVMMWDDIILNAEDISALPDDIQYLDWDYSEQPKPELRNKIAQKPNVAFCCGTSSWNKLINNFDQMFSNMDSMLSQAVSLGVKGYYLTNWGDFGDIPKFKLLEIPVAYGACIAWEGEARKDKYDFLKNLGKLIYNDEDILHWLIDIAKYQVVSYMELVYSLESEYLLKHNMDKKIVELSPKLEKLDYAKLSAIEELMYGKLPAAKDKSFILDIINIIEGIRVFNKFDLQSYKYQGSFDELTSWYYDFCKAYRKENKEGELGRNTEIIRKLMLRFRDK